MCADLRDSPREFRIYGMYRSGDWMTMVGPTQCVALFKDFHTSAPVSYRGEPFQKISDCKFVLFDRLDEAKYFCEQAVKKTPSICAEIFDHQGRAKAPLLVVMDPSVAEKEELSASSVRQRRVWALTLLCGGAPLIAYDWSKDWDLIWPAVLGFNIIIAGLRFLHWNTGRAERESERERRAAAHLAREKSDSMTPQT
jgi:hypothetical protein